MSVEILMPSLDASMTSATVVQWLKSVGDAVAIGDPIVEIETDKAVIEIEAEAEGRLVKIIVADGDSAPVNSAIGLILLPDESWDKANLSMVEVSKDVTVDPAVLPASARVVQQTSSSTGARIFASPLARRLAALEGLELSQLSGSGPSGRIVKYDIKNALAAASAKSVHASPPQTMPLSDEFSFLPKHEIIPNTAMRKSIASRLTLSSQQVPHYFLNLDCEMDKLLALRKEFNNASHGETKVTLNDFFIRAAAIALKKVPAANSAWTDSAILRFSQADISVAVAIEGGLITPVIRNADAKKLALISQESQSLTAKARGGKLRPEEYKGGTFTISNLGMFGITSFTSIINPPQGAILSIGAVEQRPIVKDGQLCAATVMTVTLAVDHRCIDGAVAAEFLSTFKRYIEMPITMLM